MNKLSLTEAIKISFSRAIKWEYWPIWIFYLPIGLYAISQFLIGKGTACLMVNPGLPLAGMMGDDKAGPLLRLQKKAPDLCAPTLFINVQIEKNPIDSLEKWMKDNNLNYPIILKPDHGCRGMGVKNIKDSQQAIAYFKTHPVATLAQGYIEGQEFGIFYMVDPENQKPFIYSLAEKTFPYVYGDGKRNLRTILLSDTHAKHLARFLLQEHQSRLSDVLEKDQKFKIINLGTHSKGSIFVNAGQHITPDLTAACHRAATAVGGFNFGRYDVRAASAQALERGDFKVLEVNGLTAEAAHLYAPNTSLLTAWRILLQQWQYAYRFGKYNERILNKKVAFSDVYRAIRP